MNYIVQPLGDQAVRIEFTDENVQTGELWSHLSAKELDGVTDIVPGIRSITVFYEYPSLEYDTLVKLLEPLLNDVGTTPWTLDPKRLIILPVLYTGPDLDMVAKTHNLTVEQVIKEHSQTTYSVKMLGFLPGFPYLSGLSETLHTPRLSTPRLSVEAGSVGIGGDQTGVYPVESPGGWNLIGRTPVPLFSPADSSPFLLKQGDLLRFEQITEEEYQEWEARINQGSPWKKEVIHDEKN